MYIFNSIKKHVGGRFKDSNKCAPAVSAADKGGGWLCLVTGGGIRVGAGWGISVLSSPFCCQFKTAL